MPEDNTIHFESTPSGGNIPVYSYSTETGAGVPPVLTDPLVIIDPMSDGVAEVVQAKAIDVSSGVLRVHGRAVEPIVVIAKGNARIFAHGNVIVQASEESEVYAYSGAYVAASGNSVSHMYKGTELTATDQAQAELCDDSTATLMGLSLAEAHQSAKVNAMDSAVVSLFDISSAVVRGVATAHLSDNSTATLTNNARGHIYSDNTTTFIYENAAVTLTDRVTDFTFTDDGHVIFGDTSKGKSQVRGVIRSSDEATVVVGDQIVSVRPTSDSKEIEKSSQDNLSFDTLEENVPEASKEDTISSKLSGDTEEYDTVYTMPSANEVKGEGNSLSLSSLLESQEKEDETFNAQSASEQNPVEPVASSDPDTPQRAAQDLEDIDDEKVVDRILPPEGANAVEQLRNQGWVVFTEPSGPQIEMRVVTIDETPRDSVNLTTTSEESEIDLFSFDDSSDESIDFKIPGL